MFHSKIPHILTALLTATVIAACALLPACEKNDNPDITVLHSSGQTTAESRAASSSNPPNTSDTGETTTGETTTPGTGTSSPDADSNSDGTSTAPGTESTPVGTTSETQPAQTTQPTTQPTTQTTQPTTQPTTQTTRPTQPTETTTTPTTSKPPVSDPNTEPADPPESDHHAASELVRIKDFIPGIYVDLRYAGSNNEAGYPIYRYSDAYLRYGTVKKLAKVQSELEKQGLSLLIWDAYRPLDAQFALSQALPDKGTSPVSGKVAFNNGGTLSLAIVKADGSAVALPSDFDAEGNKSDRDFSDVSAEAAKYGKLLDDLMQKNGFDRYLNKWYRYTDTEGYSLITTATLDEDGIAEYEQWLTNCETTVNMRKGPSTSYDILAKLPNGTRVTVLFFTGKFTFVSYGGMTGYISAGYLRRAGDLSYENDLSAVKVVENYTYDMMQQDLAELAERYPDLLSISSIGKSEEGRDLTLAILGNPDAKHQIFVSAGIHAREHMNSTLAMAQIDYMLKNLDKPFGNDGKTIRDILNDTCFQILPMSNPDGIRIVQTGQIPDAFKGQYSSSIASLWKANAKGVDLNSNFDADWERYGGENAPKTPGYMGYKGDAPECAAESKAIADYVRREMPDLVLCYHCSGSVIYWEYGSNTAVNNMNRDLARRLAMTSGFTLSNPGSNSTAGLKDYVVDKLGIPSLTIEFGTTECPLELREFANLWARCRDTLLTGALWVAEQG